MIFLTGDTHGEVRRFSSHAWDIGKTLTKDDYVIILGDFGVLWANDSFDNYWLNWLNNKPWTTLFLDGNHENFDLIDNLPSVEMFGNSVGKAHDSVFHLKRGRTYNINEKIFFILGGAASIDKAYRQENISWWARENVDEEELNLAWANLKKHNFEVDYVLTHTCPSQVKKDLLMSYGYKDEFFDPLEAHLADIEYALKFKHWFFGHFHQNINLGKFTCLYENIIDLGDY